MVVAPTGPGPGTRLAMELDVVRGDLGGEGGFGPRWPCSAMPAERAFGDKRYLPRLLRTRAATLIQRCETCSGPLPAGHSQASAQLLSCPALSYAVAVSLQLATSLPGRSACTLGRHQWLLSERWGAVLSGRLVGLELRLPDVLAVPATSVPKVERLYGTIQCYFQACP